MPNAISYQPERAVRSGERNSSVDIARLLAVFGVIALHVQYSTRAAETYNIVFWPLAVSFFYAASLTYFVAGFGAATLSTILSKMGWRIALPYLAWTLIYTGLLIGKRLVTGHDVDLVLWRVLFYGESAVQLHFLPTLMMLQLTAFAGHLVVTDVGKSRLTGLLLLAVAAGYCAWGDLNNCFGIAPTGRVAGFLAYIATAFWLAPKIKSWPRPPYYALAGAAMVLFAVLSNAAGHTYVFLAYPLIISVGGIGLLFLAVGLRVTGLPKWLPPVLLSSYGVYLIHVVYLELIEFALNRLRPNGVYYDFALKTTVIVSVFILSLVSVLLIRKVPLASLLLLGEKKQPVLLKRQTN